MNLHTTTVVLKQINNNNNFINISGKYYVPLSVDYACLARHLGPYDVLDARAVHLAAPLHPVTIHVNFQPCMNYHVKREPAERDWRAT